MHQIIVDDVDTGAKADFRGLHLQTQQVGYRRNQSFIKACIRQRGEAHGRRGVLFQNPAAGQNGPQHIEILFQPDHVTLEVFPVICFGGTELVVQTSLFLEEMVDHGGNLSPLRGGLIDDGGTVPFEQNGIGVTEEKTYRMDEEI